jgi:nucleoside-diphosphate-sugar epimerase
MGFDRLTIAGCGDIGGRVARLAADRGIAVTVLARSFVKCRGLDAVGVTCVTGDLDEGKLPHLPLGGTAVLYSAPPPGGGIVDTRVRNFLAAISPGNEPERIVYLSTTSVYGDCGSDPVDEDHPVNPGNHTARRRVDAEERFRSWGREYGVAVVILRVAGIYGPGRIPLDRIMNRHPILRAEEAGFTNRIHADDLAAICLAALERGEDGDIFNICDGETSTMTDYFNAITDQLGLPPLPQVPRDEAREVMTPLMYGYMTESRRIDNRRMLAKLGITLKYRTLREGLEASLKEQ